MIDSEVLLLAIGSAIIALMLIILIAIRKTSAIAKTEDEAVAAAPAVPGPAVRVRPQPLIHDPDVPGPRNRAAANRNARARMRMAQAQRQQQQQHLDESASEEEVAEAPEQITLPEGKIGKKKLAKLQLKAEKKVQREQEEKERKEKKERDQMLDEIRKAEEKKQQEEEAKREEEERKRREEEERREQEEYEQMKMQFQVEEEGFDETTEQNEKDLLTEFVTYIQKSKVVILEDLAALFKLKTQAVIDRITVLQKEGRLTGVIDDRGKFIFINKEELESVAKFIRQRGRVSLSDLAEASNSLVNLNPENNEGG